VSFKSKEKVISAICKELQDRESFLENQLIDTIYFGGGTPSAIEIEGIQQILDTIYKNYQVSPLPEITLEANPDDLTEDYLKDLKKIGINRLSIGVQSFYDKHLKWMNRRHNAFDADMCINSAKAAGFDNINIDLIYGIPGMTDFEWNSNLTKFFELGIPHLSAYHLTIEPKTVFGVKKKRGDFFEIEEEDSVSQFNILTERMNKEGYVHYEISNFAREGCFSQHNLGYWKNKYYLGVGPSAHSFNGMQRKWNTRIHSDYINGVNSEKSYFEMEVLTEVEKFNDYILTNLRTIWGINTPEVTRLFGQRYTDHILQSAAKYLDYIITECEIIKLNHRGKFIADRIASELFMDNE
jgi:oxygen-independent coproporphyrinogen-3 oxidase